MEENKLLIREKEARNIIIQKLRNRKIECLIIDKFREDISNENFEMEIHSAHYYGGFSNETKNYDKVTIQISTKSYPHIRRRLKEFDVMNDDYSLLVDKVKFIIQEDIKKKSEEKIKEEKQNSNLELLKQKLQGLGARKEQYGNSYIIKNKYFEISFYVYDDKISIDIEEKKDMTLDQAIELINKLKE